MARRLVSRLHLLHRATAERLLLQHLLAADLTAATNKVLPILFRSVRPNRQSQAELAATKVVRWDPIRSIGEAQLARCNASEPGMTYEHRRHTKAESEVSGAGRLAALRLPSASLRSRIIDSLRHAIETGVLQPGARLVERELCEQLQVSRTSLREALGELQAEGILAYSANRRLSVSVISRADAENAYRIRGTLEALAVEQFIEKATEEERAALVVEGKRMKAAYRAGDIDEMLIAKRAFYNHICSGAKNILAFDIINRLVLRTSGLRRRSLSRRQRQKQSIEEVGVLVDAIMRRDVRAARNAAIQHVASAAKSALDF